MNGKRHPRKEVKESARSNYWGGADCNCLDGLTWRSDFQICISYDINFAPGYVSRPKECVRGMRARNATTIFMCLHEFISRLESIHRDGCNNMNKLNKLRDHNAQVGS